MGRASEGGTSGQFQPTVIVRQWGRPGTQSGPPPEIVPVAGPTVLMCHTTGFVRRGSGRFPRSAPPERRGGRCNVGVEGCSARRGRWRTVELCARGRDRRRGENRGSPVARCWRAMKIGRPTGHLQRRKKRRGGSHLATCTLSPEDIDSVLPVQMHHRFSAAFVTLPRDNFFRG